MGLFDWFKRNDAAERPAVFNPAGPAVLIVRGTGDALAQALQTERPSVVVLGHDEPRLLDRVAAAGPSVIVIEIESSGTNGFLVHKKIKNESSLRTVPVVMFSQEVDEETFKQHAKLRTRADAYVTSVDPDRIKQAVRSLSSSSPG